MNRRHFMKAAGLAGFSVFTPTWGRGEEATEFEGYKGPYWLTINLIGGWDTTMFCDPKGREESVRDNKPINLHYGRNEIETIQGLRLAPDPTGFYGDFMSKYASDITIINGVDSQTNGHTQGVRATWSGQLAAGYPSLAAVIAAERMKPYELPLPLLTFGGYEATGDLVAPTRLADTSLMFKVVDPNTASFDHNGMPGARYQDDFALQRSKALAKMRLETMRSNASLPRTGRGLDALFTARLSEKNVGRLLDELKIDEANSYPGRGDEFMKRQAYIALSAFKAELCVSANLTLGGWDSHGANDDYQNERFQGFFDAMNMIMQKAEDLGLEDKLHIVVASDFGRTPYYNGGDGKDHWSVGSWMVIRPNNPRGGQAVGGTDAQMKGVLLDAQGMPSSQGETITPAHLHKNLRAIAGVPDDSPINTQYPLQVSPVNLLS